MFETSRNFEWLFNYRIKEFLSGTSNITRDVSVRETLIENYIKRVLDNIFIGQGFGISYVDWTKGMFWTDITLFSFMIPFGLVGLYMMSIYFLKVIKIIKSTQKYSKSDLRNFSKDIFFVLLVLLLLSLNDDIWSHKSFAIYFALIISSLKIYK